MKPLITFLLTVWLAGGGAAQEPEKPPSQDQQSKQEAPAQPPPPARAADIWGAAILSDTRGFDFGPYLAPIVSVVRRNWYAEMPMSAQTGEKGRVAIVFEILKDGSVPQIRVVASSGSDPLDRAAVAGIRDSVPFPPLPQEFTGNHLVLQFVFLYNLGSGRGSGEGSKEKSRPLFTAEPAPTARWSGMIVRSDKDASTLTVRRRGTTLEKIVHYDSSTKWTTQEGKEVKPIEMSEVKDGERVICLGSYDEKGEFRATRIDLRQAGGNYVEPTAISRPFPEYTRKARKAKVEGIVALRFTVDAQGKVSDIQVTKSLGLGLDEKTVQAVSKWKFHPATRDGVPVPAPMSVAFRFGPSYRTPQEDAQAGPTRVPPLLRILQHPPEDFGKGAYWVGEGVSAPIPIYQPMPAYSEEARHAKLQGAVVLWIVVDNQGNVSDVRVQKSLGKGLDEKAVETVKTWKFIPGMRKGVPVPVLMSVEVLFRLM